MAVPIIAEIMAMLLSIKNRGHCDDIMGHCICRICLGYWWQKAMIF